MKKKWLWEFSKRIVVACAVLYFVGIIFAMVVMLLLQDLSGIDALIENLTTVMESCVFGYFIKAGIENVFKITKREEES